MVLEIEDLNRRVEKLEEQKNQELLALVEILSNATFFGELKKSNCQFAKDGQCSYFHLKDDAKGKIPIVTHCRIQNCEKAPHCHIEISSLTCTLCPKANNQ